MDIRKKKYLITNSFFDRSFKNFITVSSNIYNVQNQRTLYLFKETDRFRSIQESFLPSFLESSKRKKITFSLSLSLPLSPYLDFLGNRDVERELVCSTRL